MLWKTKTSTCEFTGQGTFKTKQQLEDEYKNVRVCVSVFWRRTSCPLNYLGSMSTRPWLP